MKTNLMYRSMLALLALLFSINTYGANEPYYTISGTVKDARSKNEIAFASIYVPGTNVGTVANLNGLFTLKVQKSFEAQTLEISHLGYKTESFTIKDFLGEGHEFFIQSHSVALQEVVIWPDDARKLVAEAFHKVKENYPQSAQRLKGFYREAIKQRRNYISVSEALVDIYQSPYPSTFRSDRVKLIRGRKSGDVSQADTLLLKLQGGPSVAMLLDVVKNTELFISSETLDFYNYEIINVVKVEDKMNYVVSFTPRLIFPFPLYYGNLYISTENHAVTMAEFSLDLSDVDKAANNFIQRKPRTLRFRPLSTRYFVTYKEIDGIYQLNYIRSELEFAADFRRRLFRTRYNVMFEMAITEREKGDVERFAARDVFSPRSILADLVPIYFTDDFWGEYNYIEPEESIESAIMKLNTQIEQKEGK